MLRSRYFSFNNRNWLLNTLILFACSKDSLIELSIPPYRTDVKREADIVEEILRIYGYNNINLSKHLGSEFLSKPSKAKIEEDFVNNIINLLISNGYYEITTNSLTSIRFVENEKL